MFTVSSAKNSFGEVTRDPKIYIPLVKKVVSKPFSNPKQGPAVPTWRTLSDKEKKTGIPHWWEATYSRDAKDIPSETWSGLVSPTDPQELLSLI